jgi:HlyD family secretion protein
MPRAGHVGIAGGGVVVAGLAWVRVPALLRPTVRRERILTAVVERGPVEAVVEASGTVLPAFEKVLSSPDDARGLRILRRRGESVRAGDEILELDVAATRLEIERTVQPSAQKESEREDPAPLPRRHGAVERRATGHRFCAVSIHARIPR